MKTMLRKQIGRKISKLNMNKCKAVSIPERIFQNNNKLFVTINPRNACKLEFSDHLWLPILEQPNPDIVIFAIFSDI